MTTDPADTLNFNNPTGELTAQTFTIKNGPGCGTLIINSVSIDAQPFFSLIDPKVTPGTQIAGGMQAEATVQYKRPTSGGMQLGTLRIASNDPDYAPPANKLVTLQSQSPLDEIPVSVATACAPSALIADPDCASGPSTTVTVNLSTVTTATDGKKYMTISGFNSYDPDAAAAGGKKPVVSWKFKMLPPVPGNAPTSILENNDTFTANSKAKMEISATGLYRVQLQVRDDRMQLSSNSAVISVNVFP